jgi:hypothetical protein
MPPAPDTTDDNTVSVTGIDPLGNQYDVSDSASVTVIDPAIDLVKTVDKTLVPTGTRVTYGFDVTNVGQSNLAADDVLANIRLGDLARPAQPSCRQPDLVSKTGGNQDDLLDRIDPPAPPEVWHYACSSVIDRTTTDVAAVRGTAGTTLTPPVHFPVFDADAARVTVFHPGISVEKTADPAFVVGSGEVTYTYRVRNTGDVPLAGVKDRITDDTCAPVRYVSGDIDKDDLLDTPTSIFEDAFDETWVFRCRTTIDETTTNTVTTPATPVDPGGSPLCDSTAQGVAAGRAIVAAAAPGDVSTCDVRDRDRETVRSLAPATITVTKATTTDTSQRFTFSLGGVRFRLGAGDSRTFDDLAPGTYRLHEANVAGWEVGALVCRDPNGDTVVDTASGSVDVRVGEGESVSCTVTNESTAALPETGVIPPGGLLPDTGAEPGLLRMLLVGLLLVLIGGAEIAWLRARARRDRD